MIKLLTELDPIRIPLYAVLATLVGIIINSLLTWTAFRRADKAEKRAKYNAAITEVLNLSSSLFHQMELITSDPYSYNPENIATYNKLHANASAIVLTIKIPKLAIAFDKFVNAHNDLTELIEHHPQANHTDTKKRRSLGYIEFRVRCHKIAIENTPFELRDFDDD